MESHCRSPFLHRPSMDGDVESGDLGLGHGRKPGGIVDPEVEDRSNNNNDRVSSDPYAKYPSDVNDGVFFDDFLLETLSTSSSDVEPFNVADVLRRKRDDDPFRDRRDFSNGSLRKYIDEYVARRRKRSPSPKSAVDGVFERNGGDSPRLGVKNGAWDVRSDSGNSPKIQPKRRMYRDNSWDLTKPTLRPNSPIETRLKRWAFDRDSVAALRTENASLKAELDRRDELLKAKQKAVKIIHAQLEQTTAAKEAGERKAKERIELMEREINKVMFESHCKEGSLISSQETWAQRFDRVSEENHALMMTLQAKSEQCRDLHLRIDALQREKEELLVLCDTKEKSRMAKLTEISSPEDLARPPSDLADWMVLGACACDPSPCPCARVATHLRKKISDLSVELDSRVAEREEAKRLAVAYRVAMDEQIQRGRDLARQLVVMSTKVEEAEDEGIGDATSNHVNSQKKRRAQDTFKWVLHQLNTDDWKLLASAQANEETRVRQIGEERREMARAVRTEAALLLAEMLNDLNESLNQQKVVCNLLSIRNQELEAELDERSPLRKEASPNPTPQCPVEGRFYTSPESSVGESLALTTSTTLYESGLPAFDFPDLSCPADPSDLFDEPLESPPSKNGQVTENVDHQESSPEDLDQEHSETNISQKLDVDSNSDQLIEMADSLMFRFKLT